MAAKNISIIIPAYSGTETIVSTLESIAGQSLSSPDELVILQDGPRPELEARIRDTLSKLNFGGAKVNYKILAKNVGRFQARLEGAKLASFDQLLFVDDRVELADGYIKTLQTFKQQLLIGNVIEKRSKGFNPIAATLAIARRSLYDSTFESNFKDYEIGQNNFESSPKGTASLYINKQLFIDACNAVAEQKAGTDSRYFNEDTGLMRYLIDSGHTILRTSKLVLYYRPRTNFNESVKHLYGRGPRFVDYYINPRSRFFPVLLANYSLLVVVVLLIIFGHELISPALVLLIAGVAIVSLFRAKSFKEFLELLFGIPLVLLIFMAGIVKGTIIKLRP